MDEWERIEYKPIPVRTLLVEMKNISELMIDLAYSSALFNSHELAEDVLELEKRVDTLALLLKMNIMIAARDARDAEDLLGVSLVSSSADKISDAAADIAYIVLRGIGIHPAVREAFERVEERLGRFEVKRGSILVDRRLRELRLASRIGVDIIAIRRGRDWIIDPKGEDKILEGDVLIARGAPSGIEELRGLSAGTLRRLED
ncbi:MAG: potassium channel protein [Candidatus Bathyarchaeota archaeon B63]|nr:MAG: potassium channel protein [Candidatus Bathyarchaeota archaeon B63]